MTMTCDENDGDDDDDDDEMMMMMMMMMTIWHGKWRYLAKTDGVIKAPNDGLQAI